jgi:hypothetical protein
MKKMRLDILASPAFPAGLGLLILNDFLFKPAFHNWLTCKLSVIAGLLVFHMFRSALFQRFRNFIHTATILLFGYWKSDDFNIRIDEKYMIQAKIE